MTARTPRAREHRGLRLLIAHRRMLACSAIGAVAAFAWPGDLVPTERFLVGWNTFTWLYLALAAVVLARADAGHIKRLALAQVESAPVALSLVVVAAVSSLVAVVFELIAAKAAGPHHEAGHLVFAMATVIGSWLLLPTIFSLSYAATYYGPRPDRGLVFPGAPANFEPDHTDFLYFSITIAVTAQTSDVGVTTREMRRLVAAHSVLSFAFNTSVLAFSINAAAGFF